MKFRSRSIISLCGFCFVGEIAEVAGFIIARYRSGPFFTSFVPVDAFVFRCFAPIAGVAKGAAFDIAAVLGEGADAKIPLAVVPAVVIDMVDDEMVRRAGYLAVHFDAPSVFLSNGVAIFSGAFGEPCIFTQGRIVLGVDDGKQAPGQGYQTWSIAVRIGQARRVEVQAMVAERVESPVAFCAFFLAADKDGPAGAAGVSRKAAVVAAGPGFAGGF